MRPQTAIGPLTSLHHGLRTVLQRLARLGRAAGRQGGGASCHSLGEGQAGRRGGRSPLHCLRHGVSLTVSNTLCEAPPAAQAVELVGRASAQRN